MTSDLTLIKQPSVQSPRSILICSYLFFISSLKCISPLSVTLTMLVLQNIILDSLKTVQDFSRTSLLKSCLDGPVIIKMDSFPKDGPVTKAAHEYLDQYKGLDFLVEFYGIEHLQSIEDAVDDLIVCCQNNGGCHDNRVAEGNVWVAERSNLLPFRFGTRP